MSYMIPSGSFECEKPERVEFEIHLSVEGRDLHDPDQLSALVEEIANALDPSVHDYTFCARGDTAYLAVTAESSDVAAAYAEACAWMEKLPVRHPRPGSLRPVIKGVSPRYAVCIEFETLDAIRMFVELRGDFLYADPFALVGVNAPEGPETSMCENLLWFGQRTHPEWRESNLPCVRDEVISVVYCLECGNRLKGRAVTWQIPTAQGAGGGGFQLWSEVGLHLPVCPEKA